jgi:CheY-like chemotaxis protein
LLDVAGDQDVSKIVYIEDNAENQSLVVRILESTGQYRVFVASDGETGLSLIADELPVLVLVDLDIPGVNGFEVTRLIKSSDNPAIAEIPVAAVSANVLKDERNAALAAGCITFIEKPFDIGAFRTRVAQLIANEKVPTGGG